MDEIIHYLAVFVSRLWQIHVFGEGNTRTTAVFFIKYLRTLGFDVTNDIFAENAWYFRNSLVRTNYNDLKNGIHETTEYLEAFLRNLLSNEKHPLHNRILHISGTFTELEKANIGAKKANIDAEKVNIEDVFTMKKKLIATMRKLKMACWKHKKRGNGVFASVNIIQDKNDVIHINNNRCDAMAREARKAELIVDEGYEK